VLAAVVAAGAMLVAGVPMGLLWGATAPRVNVTDLLQNSSETTLEAQPASDARFALLGIVFGVVAGAIAAWRGRRAGWPLPVGLALGGLGGSLVAAQTGHMTASADALAGVPPTARAVVRDLVDVSVRAGGVHAAYPLAALLVFLFVALLTTRGDEPVTPTGAASPQSHPFANGQPGPSGPAAASPGTAPPTSGPPTSAPPAPPTSAPPAAPPPPPDAWWSAPR
jgi:hypothetical protein